MNRIAKDVSFAGVQGAAPLDILVVQGAAPLDILVVQGAEPLV